MEEKVEFEKTLTISDIVQIIRHRFIWIVLIIFACVLVGYGYTELFQKTKYTAKSSICVQANDYVITDSDGKEVTANVAEHTKYQFSALLAPEYEKVLKSEEVANALKSQGLEVNISSLSFKFTENSAFFDVTYTYQVHGGDSSVIKQEVANKLNAYIKKSIEVINDENSVYPTYLKDKLINYSLASAETVSVNTGATKTLLLAFLIGVILSAVLVIILYFTDNTIKDREELEIITGLSNLAVIDLYTNQTIGEKNTELGGKV